MRSFHFLLGSFLLLTAASAHADVIYDLTLTSSTPGNPGGSGSFTINKPPPTVGTENYLVASGFSFAPGNNPGTPGDVLLAFSATLQIGKYITDSFSLANIGNPDFPYITFTNGVPTYFYGLSFLSGSPSNQSQFSVGATTYGYSNVDFLYGGAPVFTSDSGTVTITPAAAAVTPEPASLVLLLTGSLGLVCLYRRVPC